jgi:hypothetical protein
MAGLDQLVYDISAVNLPAIARRNAVDVRNNGTLHRPFVAQIKKPVRRASIPQQVMPAQDETIIEREGGNRIGGAIIVIFRPPPIQVVPFHVVLGDDKTGISQHEIGEFGIGLDRRSRDCRPVNQPFRSSQFPQFHGLVSILFRQGDPKA